MLGVVVPQCLPDGPWRWPSTVRGESLSPLETSSAPENKGSRHSRPCSTSSVLMLRTNEDLPGPHSLIWEDMEMKDYLNPLKLSQICFFNPVNRSRSVSGASTGLSSSPLSSPRVRLDPQVNGDRSEKSEKIEQKTQFHEAFLPPEVSKTPFLCLRFGFVVYPKGLITYHKFFEYSQCASLCLNWGCSLSMVIRNSASVSNTECRRG